VLDGFIGFAHELTVGRADTVARGDAGDAVRVELAVFLANPGTPFTCHAGSSITEKGSSSRATSAKVRTICCVAAERFFKISAALQASASSTVALSTVSRMIAEIGALMCMAYLPSSFAFLISCERYCLSLAESLLSDISSSAATACSGDPPKNVFTMCLSALARTCRVSSAGR